MTTQTAPDTDSVDLAEFRSTVRAFANAEIHPGAAARDESKEFPAQLVKRLGQHGRTIRVIAGSETTTRYRHRSKPKPK